MQLALAAAAIMIVAVVLHLRLEKILMLNFTRVNTAVTNLETNANPGETAADQAQLDQLAGRLEAVGARFAAPAAPATDTPATPSSDSNANQDNGASNAGG
jgi:hypothetical protein